ncbi:MAG TPA: restriction endonuclease [Pyrinomonadaceae bacterium]|jgi:hypothetical protein
MRDDTQKMNLSPDEYEGFITELIKQLSFSKHAKIFRNVEFTGVRQPGKYEIDIALEIDLDSLNFLIIVECKNWKRPVDRPIIQKFAQTKDAISAHKAVIVSPIGFTKEAIDVAKSLGIALWVVSKTEWIKTLGFPYKDKTEELISKFRDALIDKLEINYEYLKSLDDIGLVEYENVLDKPALLKIIDAEIDKIENKENKSRERDFIDETEVRAAWLKYSHYRFVGSLGIVYNSPYLCRGDAISEIIDSILIYKNANYALLLQSLKRPKSF